MATRRVLPRRLGLLGLVWVLGLVPAVGMAKAKARAPELSGTWILNEEKSQSLQDAIENAIRPPTMDGDQGDAAPPDAGDGGSLPDRGEGPGFDGGMDPARDSVMATLANLSTTLVIQQSDSTVIVTDHGRPIRTLLLGGEQAPIGSGLDEMRARWDGPHLEVTGASADGRKFEEHYSLSKHGRSLTVISKAQGPGGRSIQLKRVYDRYRVAPQ